MCARVARGGEIGCVREWPRIRSKGARDCGGGWVGQWAPGLGAETTRNPSSHHERSSLAVPRQKKGEGGGEKPGQQPLPSQVAETCGCGEPARGPPGDR